MNYHELLGSIAEKLRERIAMRTTQAFILYDVKERGLAQPSHEELRLRARIASLTTQIHRLVTALDCIVDAAGETL